jgi:hypothetical protein
MVRRRVSAVSNHASRERGVVPRLINVIGRSTCDEAIQSCLLLWIASLALAMTAVHRSTFCEPRHPTEKDNDPVNLPETTMGDQWIDLCLREYPCSPVNNAPP